MIFCPECGAKLVCPEARFCHQCGMDLTALTPVPSDADRTPSEVTEAAMPNESEEALFDISALESKGGGTANCYEIQSTYSKDAFVRAAWIALARNHAPEEIFKSNMTAPSEREHQLFVQYAEAELSYQARIGAEREFEHIERQTYYEDVPCTWEEYVYNAETRASEKQKVTGIRCVPRDRIVKHRTVVDLTQVRGSLRASSYAAVENQQGVDVDADLFVRSFLGVEEGTLVARGESFRASDEMRAKANLQCRSDFYGFVYHSLNAPCREDIRYQVQSIPELRQQFYIAKEYRTSISLGDKTHELYAFPFGDMPIGGAKIDWENSPEREAAKKTRQAQNANREDEKKLSHLIFKHAKPIAVPAMLLLVLSMVISCFLREPWVVILAFALSTAAFVLSLIGFHKAQKSARVELEEHIRRRVQRLEDELRADATASRARMLQLLNGKLTELGMTPLSDEEF